MEEKDLDVCFFNLVTLLSQTCWYQLGKVPNPADGQIIRNLQAAQFTIDTLVMIRDKTKNNLSKKEQDLLNSVISNLQLNYADESSKQQTQTQDKTKKTETIQNTDTEKEANPDNK
jgi:hypothetical protein